MDCSKEARKELLMCEVFNFKQFNIHQEKCAMKVGTDGVLLGAWAQGGRHMLDVGCGTGIISLMLAQRFSDADITSIDIVDECCQQTRENADRTPWAHRIAVVNQSLQDFTALHLAQVENGEASLFDAIVSNPPFFVDSLKNPDEKRTLARHTDSLPLSTLARSVSRLLSDDGVFSVMLTSECYKDFIDEAWFSGLFLVEDLAVKTTIKKSPKRHLLLFSKQRPMEVRCSEQLLQNPDGSRSLWYQKLSDDFYVK